MPQRVVGPGASPPIQGHHPWFRSITLGPRVSPPVWEHHPWARSITPRPGASRPVTTQPVRVSLPPLMVSPVSGAVADPRGWLLVTCWLRPLRGCSRGPVLTRKRGSSHHLLVPQGRNGDFPPLSRGLLSSLLLRLRLHAAGVAPHPARPRGPQQRRDRGCSGTESRGGLRRFRRKRRFRDTTTPRTAPRACACPCPLPQRIAKLLPRERGRRGPLGAVRVQPGGDAVHSPAQPRPGGP